MIFLALLTVAAGVYGIVWKVNRQNAQQKLDAITARLDAEDPDWRFEQIVAEHNAKVPPPETNSALRAGRIIGEFPDAPVAQERDRLFSKLHERQSPNEAPRAEDWKQLEALYAVHEKGIAELRTWNAQTPRGRMKIEYSGSPLGIRLDSTQRFRQVSFLLSWDAMHWAERGETGRALGSSAAAFHFIQSIEFEPFVITYLIRLAAVGSALTSAEQTLAWSSKVGDPALAELQALIAKDRATITIRPTIRCSRAMQQRILEMIERGEVLLDKSSGQNEEIDGMIVSKKYVPQNLAFMHGCYDEWMRWLDLPAGEKALAIRDYKPPAKTRENSLALGFNPGIEKILLTDLRVQAKSLCAELGIASERYRLKHGQWPKSPDDLKAFGINAWPVDPCDGQLLRFRHEVDGMVIYSVGEDGRDDDGAIHSKGTPKDVGFRLWNPEKRRIPVAPNP